MKPTTNKTKQNITIIGFTLLIGFVTFCYAQFSVTIDDNEKNNVSPGDTYTTVVTILNIATQDATARIYLSDYQTSYGEPQYEEPNTLKRSNADWIRLNTNELVIPAREKREIPIEIIVPSNENLSGSYWSLIIVEGESKETQIGSTTDQSVINVNIVSRHGLNIITSFANGSSEFEFKSPNLQQGEDNLPIFTVDTTNIGSRIARGEVYLDLFANDGSELGRINTGKQMFRPENPVRINFDFAELVTNSQEKLTQGTYTALMIIDAGENQIFGARYNLNFQ